MDEAISRRGEWWTKNSAGEWLRWNEQGQKWEHQQTPPPPPGPDDSTGSRPLKQEEVDSGSTILLMGAIAIALGLIAVLTWLSQLIGLDDEFAKNLAAAPLAFTRKIQKSLARAIRKPALSPTPSLRQTSGGRRFPWHYMGLIAGALVIGASQVIAFVGGFIGALLMLSEDSALIVGLLFGLAIQLIAAFIAGRWIRKATDRWLAAIVVFALSSRLIGILTDFLLTPASIFEDFYGVEKSPEALLSTFLNPAVWIAGLVFAGIAIGGAWTARNWVSRAPVVQV